MLFDLSIIIVNWNGIGFLPDCLESIVKNPPRVSYEIVLVDNASSDKSVEWLKSGEAESMLKDVNFTLIESEENLGFGKANNLAIERTNAPFIYLLNPDTIVKPGSIDKLLETLNSDAKIGAVAPKLLNEDESLQFSVWMFPPSATKFLVEGLKLYHFLPAKIRGEWLLSRHWHHNKRVAVKVISGAAMMVKREMIDKIGGFDPKFHMYGEDAELCLRINKNNWQIIFEPAAEIIHLGGQSAIQRWGTNKLLREEEAFLNFQKEFLTPFQSLRIASARFFIFNLYLVKSFIFNRDKEIYKKLIGIQHKGFVESLKKIFKFHKTDKID